MPEPDESQQQQTSGSPAELEARLGEIVEQRLRTLLAERQQTPPPVSGGGDAGGSAAGAGSAGAADHQQQLPADLAGMVESAVARVFERRENEDVLGALAQEVADLRAKIAGAPAERRRGWGSFILGTGLLSPHTRR